MCVCVCVCVGMDVCWGGGGGVIPNTCMFKRCEKIITES